MVAVAVGEGGMVEAEAEAMVLIEIVMIHFTLVLIITVLNLMEMTTMGTTGVAILVEVITRTNRAHTCHELPKLQRTRDMVALMAEWEGLAPPTTMGVMEVMQILLTLGVAMLQTPTVVVMGTVQQLVQITTMHIGMEKVVVMEGMEGITLLPTLVMQPEVVLQVIIIVAQHRTGAGVEGGDLLLKDAHLYILELCL